VSDEENLFTQLFSIEDLRSWKVFVILVRKENEVVLLLL